MFRPPKRRGSSLPPLVRRMAACFALSLLVLAPDPVESQVPERIEGWVLDADTGDPVEGAVVEFLQPEGTAYGWAGLLSITDEDGRFALTGVPEGENLLEVHHIAYGFLRHPVEVSGEGSAAIRILVSRTAIRVAPAEVEVDRQGEFSGRGSPSSRNLIDRNRIERASRSGTTLGQFLDREVSGMRARQTTIMGPGMCVEFRQPRIDGSCRPPQVYLDGAAIHSPLDLFGSFPVSDLERIQVISPAEAGTRYGPRSGWGVVLLDTWRGSATPAPIPVVQPSRGIQPGFDWTQESEPYPWAKVYGAALVGNALGLAGGMALLSQCMDLREQTIYRNDDHCGVPMLMGSGLAAAILPPAGGAIAARLAGATDRSAGRLRYSTLAAHTVFIPGYALASMSRAGGGRSGFEIVGLAMITAGAPFVNVMADRLFRELRHR